jgi:hypothetical protein
MSTVMKEQLDRIPRSPELHVYPELCTPLELRSAYILHRGMVTRGLLRRNEKSNHPLWRSIGFGPDSHRGDG